MTRIEALQMWINQETNPEMINGVSSLIRRELRKKQQEIELLKRRLEIAEQDINEHYTLLRLSVTRRECIARNDVAKDKQTLEESELANIPTLDLANTQELRKN